MERRGIMYRFTAALFSLLVVLFLAGCGDGNRKESSDYNGSVKKESSSTTVDELNSSEEIPIESRRFTIDEKDFADTSNWVKVGAKAAGVSVSLEMNPDNALMIDGKDINITLGNDDIARRYRFPSTLGSDEVKAAIGKALFIDGNFAGIVKAYENGEIVVENAGDISEVYSRFDLQASVDEIENSMQRSIRRSLSRYDRYNKEPIRVSFSRRALDKRSRALAAREDEPVLTIEFPKGYVIPLNRSLEADMDCDIDEAMCDTSFNYDKKYEQHFDYSKTFGTVKFTTEGSKVVIGLGAYVRAMYDYESSGSDNYYFEFKPSLFYTVNLQMQISGHEIAGDDKTFELVKNGLDIEIPLGNRFVSLNLNVKPEIVIGMRDAPRNKDVLFEAHASSQRTGYARLVYSSTGTSVDKGIEESAEPLGKGSITLQVDTGEDKIVGYLFPEVAVRPQLKFLKIDKKVDIAYVRNGVSVDTKIKGIVKDDWIVENDEIYGSTVEDVFLKTYLYGLVDYKWDIKVGERTIYESDDWKELYNGEKEGHIFKLLEWMSQFLQKPTIRLEEKNGKNYLSFDIGSIYKNYIRFYYTINGDSIDAKIIDSNRNTTLYRQWKAGDEPVELSEDSTIRVRAVLFTDEIPQKADTQWVWGMSISQEAQKDAVFVPKPKISPTGAEFSDSVEVKVSQEEGDDILVSHNSGASFDRCGSKECSLVIDRSELLTAKACREFNSKEYCSLPVSGYFRKCFSDETIGSDGKCVSKCPFLWDITYSEDGALHYLGDVQDDPDAAYYVHGKAVFQDVVFSPNCDFPPLVTRDEMEYCRPYIERDNGKTTIHYAYDNFGDSYEGPAELVMAGRRFEDICEINSSNIYVMDMSGGLQGFGDFDVGSEIITGLLSGNDFTVHLDNGTLHFHHRAHLKRDSSGLFWEEKKADDNASDEDESSILNHSDDDEDNGADVDGKLEEVKAKKGRWTIEAGFGDVINGAGTIVIEGLFIDCDGEREYEDPVFGKSCAEGYDGEDGVSIRYSGSLRADMGMTPIYLFENGLQIGAMGAFEQISIMAMKGIEGTHSVVSACVIVWRDEYTEHIEKLESFSIEGLPGGSHCSVKFTPETGNDMGE